jgi:hypothetical protein
MCGVGLAMMCAGCGGSMSARELEISATVNDTFGMLDIDVSLPQPLSGAERFTATFRGHTSTLEAFGRNSDASPPAFVYGTLMVANPDVAEDEEITISYEDDYGAIAAMTRPGAAPIVLDAVPTTASRGLPLTFTWSPIEHDPISWSLQCGTDSASGTIDDTGMFTIAPNTATASCGANFELTRERSAAASPEFGGGTFVIRAINAEQFAYEL